MESGGFKFGDPWDWARNPSSSLQETTEQTSVGGKLSKKQQSKMAVSRECALSVETVTCNLQSTPMSNSDEITFFPKEAFASNILGF